MMVAPPPPLGRGMPMRRQGMGPKQKGTGVGKGRLGSAGGSGAAFVAPSQEESFQVLSLDQGRPPFAMAIRLTPEVLEDLKRAEAEDVKCEMKFGVTPAGHVRISLNVLTVSQSIYGRQFSECSTNAPLLRFSSYFSSPSPSLSPWQTSVPQRALHCFWMPTSAFYSNCREAKFLSIFSSPLPTAYRFSSLFFGSWTSL
jgi:hypothetical protein